MAEEITRLYKQASELKMYGDHAGALRVRQQLDDCLAAVGADVSARALNLNMIAFLAVSTGDLTEAERAARKCLAFYRTTLNPKVQRLATFLMMLSSVLAESRKFEEAVAIGVEAVSLFEKQLGARDSYVEFRRRDVERMRRGDTRPYLDLEKK